MPNDQYQLGELLGRGGMGQVHVARHRSGRLVAVKRVRNTLSNDRLVVDRLSDEARLLRSVSHPNVVRALDHGTSEDGMPFLVMDRAHGTPLNQLITQHGALPYDRMVAIAAQLFAGLTAIHEARIVHADLKSHNVLVDEVDIVTIIDFGLARTVTRRTISDGFVAGTPAYMAPEMIAGSPATVAADIYAAGVILYEMMTGSTPFTGHISTILTRQLSEGVEPPSRRAPGRGITDALDRVVLRALDATPAARYRTVRELAEDFEAALRDEGATRPRIARGSGFWAERQTVERPAEVARLAEGTGRTVSAAPDAPRSADAMIDAALCSAQRLIEDRRAPAAIELLEAALSSLAAVAEADRRSTGAPAGPDADPEPLIAASVWRIETVLAALYDSVGRQERGRRMALLAYRHALRTGCKLAEGRARLLVDRLVARPRRQSRMTPAPPTRGR